MAIERREHKLKERALEGEKCELLVSFPILNNNYHLIPRDFPALFLSLSYSFFVSLSVSLSLSLPQSSYYYD